MDYKVGDKIYFKGEKFPYVIQACDERFLVCTKPFNPQHTVQYTIVDLEKGIRGADNYWKWGGHYDYSKQEECQQCLKDLYRGEVEISSRNVVELEIVKPEENEGKKSSQAAKKVSRKRNLR